MPIDIAALLPNSFPTQNAHRLMVVTAEAQPDEFARLEITTADALAALRKAQTAVEEAQIEDRKTQAAFQRLAECAEKGRVLGSSFVTMADDALRHLDRLSGEMPDTETDRVRTKLTEALELSRRVSDLLAAEREVGWHRGLGRDR